MLFHSLWANIYLLNYLIAILSTVYEDMLEQGDFAYKSSKYMYIERYMIPMQDEWGFAELVVHPPPINYLVVILLPSIFENSVMKETAVVYARLIFWLENCYYMAW